MQPRRCFRFVRSGFVVLAMLLLAEAVFAHAILLESSPALNSKVSGPDVPIKLRFNVRVDKSRSRLTLVRPDGAVQSLLIGKDTSEDVLSAGAAGLAAGEYRLRWQVLASDGHITRGEILFNVQGTETH
jgi:copper resistance protein C